MKPNVKCLQYRDKKKTPNRASLRQAQSKFQLYLMSRFPAARQPIKASH